MAVCGDSASVHERDGVELVTTLTTPAAHAEVAHAADQPEDWDPYAATLGGS